MSVRKNINIKKATGTILLTFFCPGNPCAGFRDYRDFVMIALPQLRTLDGVEIQIDERILAKQRFAQIKDSILRQEHDYCMKRGEYFAVKVK